MQNMRLMVGYNLEKKEELVHVFHIEQRRSGKRGCASEVLVLTERAG